MATQVEHLLRTIETLQQALDALAVEIHDPTSVRFDLFRNAAIKSFEISLETAGKLIRKALREFAGTPRAIDALVFNELLRAAGKHGLMSLAEVERWLRYRANRNPTAHDYGVGFANETLGLLPAFIVDARALAAALQRLFNERAG